MRVTADQPERMNLLGLFMRAALEERTEALERAKARGDIALSADGMSCTLSFRPDEVVVRNGVPAKPRAHLKGSLEALLAVAQGRSTSMIATRRVRLSGNPLAALPLTNVFTRPED